MFVSEYDVVFENQSLNNSWRVFTHIKLCFFHAHKRIIFAGADGVLGSSTLMGGRRQLMVYTMFSFSLLCQLCSPYNASGWCSVHCFFLLNAFGNVPEGV